MTEHRGEMREVAGDTPLRGAPFERGVIRDVPADVTPMTGDALTDLLGAMLAVAGHLELPAVLDQFVRVSAELTCARFAAINVLDDAGTSTTFVYTGVPTAVARAMRHPRTPRGSWGRSRSTGCCASTTSRSTRRSRAGPRTTRGWARSWARR